MSDLIKYGGLSRFPEEWDKLIFTTVMARNAASILPKIVEPDFDMEDVHAKTVASCRSQLLAFSGQRYVEIFDFCRLPMTYFFDIIDRGVMDTSSISEIGDFMNLFRLQYDELNMSTNFLATNPENGERTQIQYQEFSEVMFGYLLPETIIQQAQILDQMVRNFFSMYDFVKNHRSMMRFVAENNKTTGALGRLCSLIAYTHQRNTDRSRDEFELLVESTKVLRLGNYVFANTLRELFQSSPWCKMLLTPTTK
jgi:hypothetical protein